MSNRGLMCCENNGAHMDDRKKIWRQSRRQFFFNLIIQEIQNKNSKNFNPSLAKISR